MRDGRASSSTIQRGNRVPNVNVYAFPPEEMEGPGCRARGVREAKASRVQCRGAARRGGWMLVQVGESCQREEAEWGRDG